MSTNPNYDPLVQAEEDYSQILNKGGDCHKWQKKEDLINAGGGAAKNNKYNKSRRPNKCGGQEIIEKKFFKL